MVIASVGRVRGIRKVGSGLVLSLSLAAAVPACDGKLASSGSLGQVACPAPDHPPAPTCGAALCGNGVRDSCQVCGPAPLSVGCADIGATSSPECGPSMCRAGAVERCDGADLGAATCATLGFGGGTLACSDRCTFQTNGCTTCLVDDRIVACRHTEVDAAAPLTLAMAATDHEVVIAWVTGPGLNGTYDDDDGSVRLARFDTRLSLIAQTGCFGPAHARGAAIARTRSGYILAIQGDGGVTVQALNLALQPTGPARVVPDAAWLTLTAREKDGTLLGGPLLTWVAPLLPSGIQHETRGTLLDDSGDEEAAPATLFADESFVSSAVFTGDAFLVTSSVRHDFIAHVALDGTVTIPEQAAIPADEYPHDAQLVWTGAEAAVLFWRNPLWAWAPVDASGGINGPLVALALEAYPRTALARGNEMWIVGSSGNSGINLAVTRISSMGEQIAPPLTVVADPEVPFLPAVAGLGRDRLIVGWIGGRVSYPGRIGLALVSP